MSTFAKCLVESKFAEATQTTQYPASAGATNGIRTIIDKATGYSPSGGTLTINIVPSGGAAAASNVKVVKTLSAGETYTFPEIVGHVLNSGDALSTLAAAANSVVIRFSGREIN